MQITSKGQVTIPKKFRDACGLLPFTEVEFSNVPEGVLIKRKENPSKPTRGQLWLERARGSATIKMTTEEIMALTRGDEY